jgi:hypothetical protein
MGLFNNKRGKNHIGQTLYFGMKNIVFIQAFHFLSAPGGKALHLRRSHVQAAKILLTQK